MKKTMRNLLTMVMVFALAIGALYMPVQKASAASVFAKNAKKYNWNMKWGKSVNVASGYSWWGLGDINVTLKNYKKQAASKKGYTKITFTYEAVPNPDMIKALKKAGKEIIKEHGGWSEEYGCWFAVFDYRNGNNCPNLSFKSGEWKYKFKKVNRKVEYVAKATCNMTLTFPKSYKNMVIAVGGVGGGKNDDKYWNGKCSFVKTQMYKEGKKNDPAPIALMRVK